MGRPDISKTGRSTFVLRFTCRRPRANAPPAGVRFGAMTMASAACVCALALASFSVAAQPAAAPKPAWSAQQSAEAAPVWPLSALPADLKPLGMARLDALKIGMHQDEVGRLLGTPHSAVIASAAAGEVWQYVVLEAADGRAFIVSLWFNQRGLWMVSARSNPVGRLAAMQFVTAAAASATPAPDSAAASPTPQAPMPAPASAAPAPAEVTLPAPAPVVATSPAPVIAAAPSPAPPVDSSPAARSPEGELRDAVDAWLGAWRQKDAAAYIAHYTADFAPPGKKREAWVSERRERLQQPVFIRVVLTDMQVQDAQGAHPRVSFVQEYESERYSEKSRKVLTFVSQDGRWLIEKEENAKLAP